MTTYLTLQNTDNLRALRLSIELARNVGSITESLPFEEGHIKDQLKRASTSIVQNVAKAEQLYVKNKVNLYSIAMSSAQETKSWLMTCTGKGLISEGEFLALDSMIETIIKMLNKILVNLKNTRNDLDYLPTSVAQDVKMLPCFQKAQTLVKELHEMESAEFGEWHRYIKNLTVNAACNIASHVSEGEQIYPKKKFSFLNLAFQESNAVKANLDLLSEAISDKEKYHELKEMVIEIQHLLVREMKRIDPGIKDKL